MLWSAVKKRYFFLNVITVGTHNEWGEEFLEERGWERVREREIHGVLLLGKQKCTFFSAEGISHQVHNFFYMYDIEERSFFSPPALSSRVWGRPFDESPRGCSPEDPASRRRICRRIACRLSSEWCSCRSNTWGEKREKSVNARQRPWKKGLLKLKVAIAAINKEGIFFFLPSIHPSDCLHFARGLISGWVRGRNVFSSYLSPRESFS